MFRNYLICNLFNQRFPICWWNQSLFCDFFTIEEAVSIKSYLLGDTNYHYFCACTASYINNAFLRFLPLSLAIFRFRASGSDQPSLLPTCRSTAHMSLSVGAATLTSNVRDRMGAIIFDVELASNISLRFGEYFSRSEERR